MKTAAERYSMYKEELETEIYDSDELFQMYGRCVLRSTQDNTFDRMWINAIVDYIKEHRIQWDDHEIYK